jgi:hypothetical protein
MMTVLLLRVLERIHGHLAWLSVVALLHPAILLANPKRRARLAVSLTTLSVAVTAVLGATIYPEYRSRIKQHIFIEAPRIGWLFERKEHVAVGAVALAVAGCIAHLSLPLFAQDETRVTVARLAHRAFVASFVLALVTALLGMVVASFKSF